MIAALLLPRRLHDGAAPIVPLGETRLLELPASDGGHDSDAGRSRDDELQVFVTELPSVGTLLHAEPQADGDGLEFDHQKFACLVAREARDTELRRWGSDLSVVREHLD